MSFFSLADCSVCVAGGGKEEEAGGERRGKKRKNVKGSSEDAILAAGYTLLESSERNLSCLPGARSLAGNCNGNPVLCCSVAHYLFPTQRQHQESPPITHQNCVGNSRLNQLGCLLTAAPTSADGHGCVRCGQMKWKRWWISGISADTHQTQWTRLGASAIWNQTNYCLLLYASYYCILVFICI